MMRLGLIFSVGLMLSACSQDPSNTFYDQCLQMGGQIFSEVRKEERCNCMAEGLSEEFSKGEYAAIVETLATTDARNLTSLVMRGQIVNGDVSARFLKEAKACGG